MFMKCESWWSLWVAKKWVKSMKLSHQHEGGGRLIFDQWLLGRAFIRYWRSYFMHRYTCSKCLDTLDSEILYIFFWCIFRWDDYCHVCFSLLSPISVVKPLLGLRICWKGNGWRYSSWLKVGFYTCTFHRILIQPYQGRDLCGLKVVYCVVIT